MPRRARLVVLCRSIVLPVLAATLVLAAVRSMATTLAGGGPLPDGDSVRADCFIYAEAAGTHAVKDLKYLVCADGDPTCDQDATCNGHCTFQARACTGLVQSGNPPPCSPPPSFQELHVNKRCPFEAPALTGSACGAFVNFEVALKGGGRKAAHVRCSARAKASPSVSTRVDKDVYVFKCVPCGTSVSGAILPAVDRR